MAFAKQPCVCFYSPDNEAKKELAFRKGLLELKAQIEILDWSDCIETTKVQTVMGCYRWSTESVARDRRFLKYLGVDIK